MPKSLSGIRENPLWSFVWRKGGRGGWNLRWRFRGTTAVSHLEERSVDLGRNHFVRLELLGERPRCLHQDIVLCKLDHRHDKRTVIVVVIANLHSQSASTVSSLVGAVLVTSNNFRCSDSRRDDEQSKQAEDVFYNFTFIFIFCFYSSPSWPSVVVDIILL